MFAKWLMEVPNWSSERMSHPHFDILEMTSSAQTLTWPKCFLYSQSWRQTSCTQICLPVKGSQERTFCLCSKNIRLCSIYHCWVFNQCSSLSLQYDLKWSQNSYFRGVKLTQMILTQSQVQGWLFYSVLSFLGYKQCYFLFHTSNQQDGRQSNYQL